MGGALKLRKYADVNAKAAVYYKPYTQNKNKALDYTTERRHTAAAAEGTMWGRQVQKRKALWVNNPRILYCLGHVFPLDQEVTKNFD